MINVLTDIVKIGDPFVLYDNGFYYMYATSSIGNLSTKDGIFCWKGEEYDKLTLCGCCYDKSDSFGYDCFWAPEVVKRADGKYIMHFTAKDRIDGVLRTGVAVSDSPEGPFKDATEGKPMFDIGTATIDASCYVEGDKAYLYFVKDCSTNIINGIHTSQIYVAEIDSSLTKLISQPKLISTPSQPWETHSLPAPCVGQIEDFKLKENQTYWLWNEAPSLIKHGGKYYLTYSANCFDSRYYSVGYAVSDSPLGPFEKYKNNPIMEYIPNKLSGPGHNSFFTDKNGNLMCAYHCHTFYEKPSGNRRYCVCSVQFINGELQLLYK